VLPSTWRIVRGSSSPEQVEAEACLGGLRLALDWVGQPIWVETNCLTLVQDLGRKNESRSRLAGLVAEIRVVGNLLPQCKFRHAYRASYEVSHSLPSSEGDKCQECVVIHFDAPPCVQAQIELERAGEPAASLLCNQGET
jgi:hypothetical protein